MDVIFYKNTSLKIEISLMQ